VAGNEPPPVERSTRERVACIQCDLLVALRELAGGERATCPRCGNLLASRTKNGLAGSLAFALAGAVLLVMANAFPFLALKASGLEHVMTLPRTALEIYREGYGAMAVIVFGVIVAVPGLMIGILIALLTALRRDSKAPWLVPAGRLLFWLSPWSMSEVFVIGVIVSLVKIGHMATVILGVSFWAYVAFAICFTAAMASLDRIAVWDEIERCSA
jgi:paraquat-inducible protein A